MCTYKRDDVEKSEIFVLLGAEGVTEVGSVPWLRAATDEEVQYQRDLIGVGADEKPRLDKFLIDVCGRPYFPMIVTVDAPLAVRSRAAGMLRMVRF